MLSGCSADSKPGADAKAGASPGDGSGPSQVVPSPELEVVKKHILQMYKPGTKVEFLGATAPKQVTVKNWNQSAALLRVTYRVAFAGGGSNGDQAFLVVTDQVQTQVDWSAWLRDKKSKYGVD
jgi:hypothetical protein